VKLETEDVTTQTDEPTVECAPKSVSTSSAETTTENELQHAEEPEEPEEERLQPPKSNQSTLQPKAPLAQPTLTLHKTFRFHYQKQENKKMRILNPDILEEYFPGDVEMQKQIVETVLDSIPDRLARIKAGLNTDDFIEIGRNAHSIKGCAANAGGEELSYLAEIVQNAGYDEDGKTIHEMAPRLPEAFIRFRDLVCKKYKIAEEHTTNHS
jgi:HPt (histidine-containing phosphotransfer) domain-containing protein